MVLTTEISPYPVRNPGAVHATRWRAGYRHCENAPAGTSEFFNGITCRSEVMTISPGGGCACDGANTEVAVKQSVGTTNYRHIQLLQK